MLQNASDTTSLLLTNFLSNSFDGVNNEFVVVLLASNRAVQNINEDALSKIFNLTDAESRLAKRLATGLSVEEVADRYFLSKHTLRSQLKAIFQKTNTARQADLVRLVLTSPAAYMQEENKVNDNATKVNKKSDTDKRINQTIVLKDGRTLGFAEFGPDNGVPIIFLHSIEACRLERLLDEQVLYDLNVRFIVPTPTWSWPFITC